MPGTILGFSCRLFKISCQLSFKVVENCRFRSSKKCRERASSTRQAGRRKLEGDFMSLRIKFEQTSDVAVVRCSGRLVRGEALDILKHAVTSLSRLRVVVLDLSEVEMLDGGGLGMLVFLHKWTRAAGVQLKVVNPSSLALEMLTRTRLTSVLDVWSLDDWQAQAGADPQLRFGLAL